MSCIDDFTPCLEMKISEFKKDSSAEAIWKFEHPKGPYYWFEDKYGDGIEEVVDENCILICISDY
jgi:hypothetical protein